jgi:NAD(P)-dependent dehydrogenase (short-subunit alcohol dehydrogenase family)
MRKKNRSGNLYGKNVFVTGASSGIGQACAAAFAKSGCAVTGVSRSTEEKTETFPGGGSLTLRRLDVTDETAVREFIEKLPGVDIAVLCAGMGVAGPAETAPSELTRRQMEVNYFGTINAAQPCLTRMRGQGRGLLIVIGSIAGRVSIPMQSQYSASKYALEALVDALRLELHSFGVKAVIVEPGDTKTGFTGSRKTFIREGSAYSDKVKSAVGKMEKDEQSGASPKAVARVVLKMAGKASPPGRRAVGLSYRAILALVKILPDTAREKLVRMIYMK